MINVLIYQKKSYLCIAIQPNGGLAQLARALAWHARGHRFEPDILHTKKANSEGFAFLFIGAKSARQWLR